MSSASTITRSPTPARDSTQSRTSSASTEPVPETRQGSKWTPDEDRILLKMRGEGNSHKVVAKALDRTNQACRLRQYQLKKNFARGLPHGRTRKGRIAKPSSPRRLAPAVPEVARAMSLTQRRAFEAQCQLYGYSLVPTTQYDAATALTAMSTASQ